MKLNINTNNFTIYSKLNELKHSSYVLIPKDKIKPFGLFRIINNINRRGEYIRISNNKDNFILEKVRSKFDINLYYKDK